MFSKNFLINMYALLTTPTQTYTIKPKQPYKPPGRQLRRSHAHKALCRPLMEQEHRTTRFGLIKLYAFLLGIAVSRRQSSFGLRCQKEKVGESLEAGKNAQNTIYQIYTHIYCTIYFHWLAVNESGKAETIVMARTH